MGKVIVITGGGAGLGLAIARRLARDGHRLFLLGRTLAKVQAAAADIGGRTQGIACNVADPDAVDAAFAEVAKRVPRIDVLINNAGVFAPFFLEEATNAQIADTLGTNLMGPMYCSRAALRMMDAGGQVFCIGSETVVVTAAMLGAYQTSKAGLERFCKTLDQEVGPRGIRVTLVRAGKMYGPDMSFSMDPDVARRFAEESLRLGVDNRKSALTRYESVAELFPALLDLPADLAVPEITLASRHA
ncbi:MAG: SDR family oxidoreductase [Novosphingobium sp.]